MSFLQMSLSGAVMILVILVLRAFTVNRLPKKTFLALWGVALLRLLTPFSVPSPFSVYSMVNLLPMASRASGAAAGGQLFTPGAANAIPNMAAPPMPTLPSASMEFVSPWVLAWILGAALCAAYFTVAYCKCRLKFRGSVRAQNAFTAQWLAGHKIRRTIQIRQLDSISAPLTYGVFHPVILMPASVLLADTSQIQYILEHEYVHIRRFDAVTKVLLTAALCLHWFNPMVWCMYLFMNRDMELSCDEAVVRSFGETIKSAYALALISMEEQKSGLLPFANSFSKTAIEERITAIMKLKKATAFTAAAAFLIVAGATTVFATSAETDGQQTAHVGQQTAGAAVAQQISPSSLGSKAVASPDAAPPDASFSAASSPAASSPAASSSGASSRDKAARDEEYLKWGVAVKSDGYYYSGVRIRILMDVRADKSFEFLYVEQAGSVDVRIVRNSGGTIAGVEEIPESEAAGLLSDLDSSYASMLSEGTADVPPPPQTEKPAEDIQRLTKEEAPGGVAAAISECADGKWYVLEAEGRQYIYYSGLPHNYAYQYEQSNHRVAVVDIGQSTGNYVLLSVPQNSALTVTYNSKPVAFTKKPVTGGEYVAVRDSSDPGPVGVGRLMGIRPQDAYSDTDARALDVMQRTGNWGYIEAYLPQMTNAGIDAVVNSYNSKHPDSGEHRKASDYYHK